MNKNVISPVSAPQLEVPDINSSRRVHYAIETLPLAALAEFHNQFRSHHAVVVAAIKGSHDDRNKEAENLLNAAETEIEGTQILLREAKDVAQEYFLIHDSITVLGQGKAFTIPNPVDALIPAPAPLPPRRLRNPMDIPDTPDLPAGRFKGKSAIEHHREQGERIGRKPKGFKKVPTREVRSIDDIEDICFSLAKGCYKEDVPTLKGTVFVFPDGTKMNYRISSRSTEEPTIEIIPPKGKMLKIHVNGKGWN